MSKTVEHSYSCTEEKKSTVFGERLCLSIEIIPIRHGKDITFEWCMWIKDPLEECEAASA